MHYTRMFNRIGFIEKFTRVTYTCSLSQAEETECKDFVFWDYFILRPDNKKSHKVLIFTKVESQKFAH